MGLLVSLVLIVALLVAAWPGALRRNAFESETEEDLEAVVGFPGEDEDEDAGLFSASFVRGRLVALATELDQLARAEGMFAQAHHLYAARTAYDALQLEAARLAEELGPIELVASGTVSESWEGPGRREVLEL